MSYFWKDSITKNESGKDVELSYFCYDEDGSHDFFIKDIHSYISDSGFEELFSPESISGIFKDAKYYYMGVSNGHTYSGPLNSSNLECAKRDFEEWYKNHLEEVLREAKDKANKADYNYRRFMEYKKGINNKIKDSIINEGEQYHG